VVVTLGHLHFLALVLDGVYTEDRATGRVRWHRSRRWTTADVEGLVVRIADRSEAWLARQGFGRAADGGREHGEDDALSVIQSASVAGRSAVGRGRWAKRVQILVGRPGASRFPNTDELYLIGAAPSLPVFAISDPGLGVETTWGLSPTAVLSTRFLNAELGGFANLVEDYIYFAPALSDSGEPKYNVTVEGAWPEG